MTSTPTLSYSHQVPPCHQPPLATTKVKFLMGSNLSKFLFGTKIKQQFRNTKCPAPPRPLLPTANKIIIHRPEVEFDSDDGYEYVFPVFLSSPYAEKDIITISDSE